jgi:hypothetical protein
MFLPVQSQNRRYNNHRPRLRPCPAAMEENAMNEAVTETPSGHAGMIDLAGNGAQ